MHEGNSARRSLNWWSASLRRDAMRNQYQASLDRRETEKKHLELQVILPSELYMLEYYPLPFSNKSVIYCHLNKHETGACRQTRYSLLTSCLVLPSAESSASRDEPAKDPNFRNSRDVKWTDWRARKTISRTNRHCQGSGEWEVEGCRTLWQRNGRKLRPYGVNFKEQRSSSTRRSWNAARVLRRWFIELVKRQSQRQWRKTTLLVEHT